MPNTYPELNYGDIYDAIAPLIPQRPAIIQGDQVMTWKVFDERSNCLARHIAALGLAPGAKIAFFLRNCPAYVELWSACVKGRFVHVNVNYRYVAHELEYLLDNSDAELVVFESDFRDQIDQLRPMLTRVKAYLEVGSGEPADYAGSFESACTVGEKTQLPISRSGDDLYFMYTGGTTGYPKAVMWPQRERIAAIQSVQHDNLAEIAQAAAATTGPVAMPAAPMMHSTGLSTVMSTLAQGGTIVLLPTPNFDARACIVEIERHQVHRLAIVGDAFAIRLLQYLREHEGRHDLSCVQLITTAGAILSEQFKRELLEHFRDAAISDSLGSSEGSGLGRMVVKRGDPVTTGRFEPGDNVKVLSESFQEVPQGVDGLLAKTGPLPVGYYKDEAKSAKTFPVIDGVRYSLAGDWCRIEPDGSMTLLGRGNNCINTGGEKVYPEEVEDALKLVPGVEDAAVLGIADEQWGQIVTAIVRTANGQPIGDDALREVIDQRIARYKHPRRIHFVKDDFRHDNGKVNYRLVRSIAET